MSITAAVVNDTIKLPEGIHLEDSTEVVIVPKSKARVSFGERYRDFVGSIKDAPPELADQHDHFLYGTPRVEQ